MWTSEWTDGPNEWTNAPNRWTNEWTDGPNEWTNAPNGWTNEWTDGPNGVRVNVPAPGVAAATVSSAIILAASGQCRPFINTFATVVRS